jgi:HSP20 family protein
MARSSWLPSIWGESREVEEPFHAMRKQFDMLFEDWARGMRLPSVFAGEGMHAPRIEMSEDATDVCITAELPGVEQKDIEVLLTGRQLTLKGEKKSQLEEAKEEKGRTIHRSERYYGAFQRMIELPYEADPRAVSATFKDGVLTITIPKPAEIKAQTRKIDVKQPS